MTPEQRREALERAHAENREAAVTLVNGTLGFYLVVELREASVMLLARGSVVERPLVPLERIEAVRVLGEPSLAALRGLAIERAKAHERRAWTVARDEEKRREWRAHEREEPKR